MNHKKCESEVSPIYFYGPVGRHGFLSNFYKSPFEFDGEVWPTMEHYFQATKTTNEVERDWIRNLKSPGAARSFGHGLVVSGEWEDRQEELMYRGLLAKFSNPELGLRLFNTGHIQLIANSPGDYYWGTGSDGTGKNRLGILMTRLRYQIGNVIGFYSKFQ